MSGHTPWKDIKRKRTQMEIDLSRKNDALIREAPANVKMWGRCNDQSPEGYYCRAEINHQRLHECEGVFWAWKIHQRPDGNIEQVLEYPDEVEELRQSRLNLLSMIVTIGEERDEAKQIATELIDLMDGAGKCELAADYRERLKG